MATKSKSKNRQAMILANLNFKKLTFLRIVHFLFTVFQLLGWRSLQSDRLTGHGITDSWFESH